MVRTLFKKVIAGLSIIITMPLLAFSPLVGAASGSNVVVRPSNLGGWVLNGDPTTATPYEFTEDQSSTGEGSLFVSAIGANPADKFIAAKPLGTPVADLSSVSYDFLIAGNGDVSDANQFYLNIYTSLPGSTSYYDCRFDYVPTTGSTTDFTTASFSATDTPVNVAAGPGDVCPTTLAGMAEGSTVSFVALNVGDTSVNDVGLAGYLDNVIITSAGNSTAYNFELNGKKLSDKEACKNGGWMNSDNPVYKNQGDCVSAIASQGKAKGNPVANFLRNL